MAKRNWKGVHFKKRPKETGLAAVGRPYPEVDVYWQGREVGLIVSPSWQTEGEIWRVRVHVPNQPASHGTVPLFGWRWAKVRRVFTSEAAARQWCLDNLPDMVAQGVVVLGDEKEE